jgi:hypothetical protein
LVPAAPAAAVVSAASTSATAAATARNPLRFLGTLERRIGEGGIAFPSAVMALRDGRRVCATPG